jgi:hypothetical protein
VALASNIQGEEYYPIAIGQGAYTAELASNIPDGYSAICYNLVATGDSLENRVGLRRLSVNMWNYQAPPTTLPRGQDVETSGYFCQIDPWGGDSSKPAFMWSSQGEVVPTGATYPFNLNLVRAAGTIDANDGFMSVVTSGMVTGICQYNGVIYYCQVGFSVGVYKVTNINWGLDTVTATLVASSTGLDVQGLFTFKDRLWAWQGNNLYFTDLPTVGGQPEQWAAAANVIKFVGPDGAGNIKSVVPLSNRLCVFTNNGLFTLLVEGAPASWILRILDSKSISTTSQCAFETKGIVYYVNTTGVWATNSLSVTKISMVIDDQWFQAQGKRIHTINPYEDGMIVSIGRVVGSTFFDKDNSITFYTKLDPIGWTEWNINSYAEAARPDRIAAMWSTTDKIPTYLNIEPTVYANLWIGDSTEAVHQKSVLQLLIFDGGSDVYVDRTNVERTAPVGIYLKTKHFDGGNQFNKKFAKKGMLEVFTSDSEHILTTSWDIDVTIDMSTEKRSTPIIDSVVGTGSNLLQIPALFWYRRAAFNLRASLQSDNSQIKIKDITIAQNTGRGAFEQVD